MQGTGADASAGYHGYWITDFTQIDPHLGTNADLKTLIDAAHAQGHEGLLRHHHQPHRGRHRLRSERRSTPTSTRPTSPYKDADGNGLRRPRLRRARHVPDARRRRRRSRTRRSFRTAADETVKVPAWLNDPTLLPQPRRLDLRRRERRRTATSSASTTCSPSNPTVVDGHGSTSTRRGSTSASTASASTPSSTSTWSSGRSSRRRCSSHAPRRRQRRLLHVRRGLRRQPGRIMSQLHDDRQAAGHARLRLPGAARSASRQGKADRRTCATCSPATTTTPTPTPTPTSCRRSSATTTWAASACSLKDAGATAPTCCSGTSSRNELMYLTRGQPVVYYGDEQGFIGDRRRQGRPAGHVRDARSPQLRRRARDRATPPAPRTATTPTSPLYQQIAELVGAAGSQPGAGRRRADPPLRLGRRRHLRVQPDRPAHRRRVPRRRQQRDDAAKSATFDDLQHDRMRFAPLYGDGDRRALRQGRPGHGDRARRCRCRCGRPPRRWPRAKPPRRSTSPSPGGRRRRRRPRRDRCRRPRRRASPR